MIFFILRYFKFQIHLNYFNKFVWITVQSNILIGTYANTFDREGENVDGILTIQFFGSTEFCSKIINRFI
ncbi:hypothetical protein OA85_05165 [Flavobacterium sp. AED]|nr:hypothetical protein OA85_05165 [Flavobacterium sp. AED]